MQVIAGLTWLYGGSWLSLSGRSGCCRDTIIYKVYTFNLSLHPDITYITMYPIGGLYGLE